MKKIILVLIFGFNSVIFGQISGNSSDIIGKGWDAKDVNRGIQNLAVNGNNSDYTNENYIGNEIELERLSNELHKARMSNNLAEANKIQEKISHITNEPQQIMNQTQVGMKYENIPVEIPVQIGVSKINSASAKIISVATTTEKYNGKIWVISTEDSQTIGADTAKVYYSTNGGMSWIRLMTIFFEAGQSYKYLANDLDIESVTNGTSTVLYVSAGVVKNGKTTVLYKFNANGKGLNSYFTITNLTNQYYGGRVCSDNAKYDGTVYVYYAFTQDSTIGVNNHNIKMNVFCITTPFDTNPIIQQRRRLTNGYASYIVSQPDSAVSYSDIACMDSIGVKDLLVTIQCFNKSAPAYFNLYMSTSNNSGLSLSRNYAIAQFTAASHPRIGTSGRIYGPYIFCTVLSKESNVDNNPKAVYSTNIGASWIENYLNTSQDTTYSVDVISITSGLGFYFAFNSQKAGVKEAFYGSYSYPNFSVVSTKMNNIESDNFLGTIRAGYRTTGSDSCLAVWAGLNGSNMYASLGCSGPFIGVNEESSIVADKFTLNQNYPNPFNPSTNISYNLKKAGFVSLVVYDNLGKEIMQLVNQNQAMGNYEINFNFEGLESGIYYYRITVNGFSETRKMVMVK